MPHGVTRVGLHVGCVHTHPSICSAPAAVVEAPPCGMCSVWTHGTSGHCYPSIVSWGQPSCPHTSPVGPSPASAGTPLPGGSAQPPVAGVSSSTWSSVSTPRWGCLRNINQCGHEAWPKSSWPCGIEDCEPIQLSHESPNPWLSAKSSLSAPEQPSFRLRVAPAMPRYPASDRGGLPASNPITSRPRGSAPTLPCLSSARTQPASGSTPVCHLS
ncbi:hypothetical protein P7K49_033841 [Saguinus oedipus]|uniref:Uncharacterized protein n=1 Tax=Saguinus oedipus TaxID=9490 RepID=A0ABQ9TT36_SAGOE|nr:hypothetical protein P7K49_033841 [Saguinus oedipus]